jgi:hypothetical protein
MKKHSTFRAEDGGNVFLWKFGTTKMLHYIDANLKTLGVRGCRRQTLDRDEWKDVMEEAKAQRGL